MSVENKNNIYYKKQGRKYIECRYYEPEGLPEGLWLIIKNKSSIEYKNMLYPMLTHKLTDVGKFSDMYKAHHEKINTLVEKELEYLFNRLETEKKGFSRHDLVQTIIAALSKLD